MDKKSVYVSFDYDNDDHYKYLIEAWAKVKGYNFSFRGKFLPVKKTSDLSHVKEDLETEINNASCVLVFVSEHSNSMHPDAERIGHKNWQNWEVAKAKKMGKSIIGAKFNPTFDSPDELKDSGASWTHFFNQPSIFSAI